MTDRKTILDYEGEASWDDDSGLSSSRLFWLHRLLPHTDVELVTAVTRGLPIDGADWHGRLHILVELVEGSE